MNKGKIIKSVILIIFVGIFSISCYKIADYFIVREKSKNLYNEIIDQAVSTHSESVVSTDKMNTDETKETKQEISINFDLLAKEYNDIVGWLYSPDTVINYPVVQGKNNSYYVNHMPNEKKNSAGSIFADYRNILPNNDFNYIVYGHNMKNNTMFGTLTDYKKQKYYDKHPNMYFITENGYYKVELFAGYVTKSNSDAYIVNHTQETLKAYMEQIKRKSTFDSPVQYNEGEKIITLSTCSYESKNSRYVVIGILKEEK